MKLQLHGFRLQTSPLCSLNLHSCINLTFSPLHLAYLLLVVCGLCGQGKLVLYIPGLHFHPEIMCSHVRVTEGGSDMDTDARVKERVSQGMPTELKACRSTGMHIRIGGLKNNKRKKNRNQSTT